jgi:acyl-coenzyme A thioesterase PaaI-like protein
VALRVLTGAAQAARRYAGQTHAGYANMIGPYGGVTAAQALAAVMAHPGRLGEPIAFTGNYATALADGQFEIEAEPVRTNRSTQHWVVRISQTGADGAPATVFTATVVTALRRSTWRAHDIPMPADLPAPESVPGNLHVRRTLDQALSRGLPPDAGSNSASEALSAPRVPWLARYDIRPIAGRIPSQWDGSEADDSQTLQWMRDEPPRPLDFISLTALADTFFPRVWLRRARHTPIGTVSITIYYHAQAGDLAAAGADYLLGQAHGLSYFNGFFDQSALLWSRAGNLLVTTHQIVYFKE